MKKLSLILFIFLLIVSLSSHSVYANMSAPQKSDVASVITFEKNNDISVLSEVLDINVKGNYAHIVATYEMKNTTNKKLSTPTMFLSPNIEDRNVKVIVNNKDAPFKVGSYALDDNTQIKTTDWKYVVLVSESETNDMSQTVDVINFQMTFSPQEEYKVTISYIYQLGGYPYLDYDYKNGIIEYYLLPASTWKDFSQLTINLYLDKDMPIIASSNLEFKEIDTRTYQYVSNKLPKNNLEIIIDENSWQEFISSFKNPYRFTLIRMFFPYILIVGSIIILFKKTIKLNKSK